MTPLERFVPVRGVVIVEEVSPVDEGEEIIPPVLVVPEVTHLPGPVPGRLFYRVGPWEFLVGDDPRVPDNMVLFLMISEMLVFRFANLRFGAPRLR